ncbi:2-acylglycerol O-acyltransferase 3-like [Alligator sinensis]|uniref:Acyltransferase n=1 Tax=Alligator sinensis TaxID=38654 RepID=A0A3Q0H8Z8_ALLSI|nr:2-acylglycerol O-acyltransferase 3-like [Alligator sinensis]
MGLSKRQLEVLSALQWMLTFLFLGPVCTALLLWLLFTRLWLVSVLYFAWWLLDWDPPGRGGRPCDWLRRRRIWTHFCDYFPIKVVRTAPLPPGRSYVLGAHPHGIACAGAFAVLCPEAAGFPRLFPGLRPVLAPLRGLFLLPGYREYLMSAGMCPVSRASLDFLLSRPGVAVGIVVGGAAEALDSAPGSYRLTLLRRTGFVRVALRHGACLVPLLSLGEPELFAQAQFAPGGLARRLQERFRALVGFAPCVIRGEWGLLPRPRPLTVVVGSPIPVPRRVKATPEEVLHYHALYVAALRTLFERHKVAAGLGPTCRLHLV